MSNGGDEHFVVLPNGQKRGFVDLISHKNEFANNVSWVTDFMKMYNVLKSFEEDSYMKIPPKDEVQELYAKFCTNNNEIYVRDGNLHHIGNWLFLDYSAIDHSCFPNATWFISGREIIVKSIEFVDDFKNIQFAYIDDLNQPTVTRRQRLLRSHHFHCECTTCLDIESDQLKSSILCPNCKADDGCIPISTRICRNCNLEMVVQLGIYDFYLYIQNIN